MNKRNDGSRDKKITPKKVLALSFTGVFLLGAGFLGYQYFRKKRGETLVKTSSPDIVINNNIPATTTTKGNSPNDNFPLKSGSRGANVGQLQKALSIIVGAAVMDAHGGVDGIFGKGTAAVLKLAGYGEVIDETTFNDLLRRAGIGVNRLPQENASAFDPEKLADAIFTAGESGYIDTIVLALRKITTVQQYSAVNSYYMKKTKSYLFIPVERSIVTDLLDHVFPGDTSAKEKLEAEFRRIGLKKNAVKDEKTGEERIQWTLAGLVITKDLITLRETYVIDLLNNIIPVHSNTVLGPPIKSGNGITWFRAMDNSILQVPTQDIKYVN